MTHSYVFFEGMTSIEIEGAHLPCLALLRYPDPCIYCVTHLGATIPMTTGPQKLFQVETTHSVCHHCTTRRFVIFQTQILHSFVSRLRSKQLECITDGRKEGITLKLLAETGLGGYLPLFLDLERRILPFCSMIFP